MCGRGNIVCWEGTHYALYTMNSILGVQRWRAELLAGFEILLPLSHTFSILAVLQPSVLQSVLADFFYSERKIQMSSECQEI